MKPKKWTEVYAYGTKGGDEEARFFKALARSKWSYRSVAALMTDAKLTRDRIEEIIDKFANKIQPPLIVPHPSNEDHWGYWERCPDQMKDDLRNISQKDQDNRVDKHLKGQTDCTGCTKPSDQCQH